MKHHAPQFSLVGVAQAPFELLPENQAAPVPQPEPDLTPNLFHVTPTFPPTEMDKRNKTLKSYG